MLASKHAMRVVTGGGGEGSRKSRALNWVAPVRASCRILPFSTTYKPTGGLREPWGRQAVILASYSSSETSGGSRKATDSSPSISLDQLRALEKERDEAIAIGEKKKSRTGCCCTCACHLYLRVLCACMVLSEDLLLFFRPAPPLTMRRCVATLPICSRVLRQERSEADRGCPHAERSGRETGGRGRRGGCT